jgi:hypothetical protein
MPKSLKNSRFLECATAARLEPKGSTNLRAPQDSDRITGSHECEDAAGPLAGIGAPEKGQAFGERSKQERLSALVFEKRVEARCHKEDRIRTRGVRRVRQSP